MTQFIRTEEQALTDTEALRYRSKGMTYQKIADVMGVTKAAAYNRVQRALRAIPAEAVEEYRKLETERLDTLLELAMRKAESEDKGFLFAIDRILAIMDRRARLLGLDAPVKTQTEVVTYSGDTIEAEVAKLRRILSEHGSEPVPVDGSAGPTGATTA